MSGSYATADGNSAATPGGSLAGSLRSEAEPATPGVLMVVAEPASKSNKGVGRTLLAEGARLAGRLGLEPCFRTWSCPEAPDTEQLARMLAEEARNCGAGLVLLADTDLGRELACLVALDLGAGAVLGCSDILPGKARSGVTGAESPRPVFVKPVYGGWLEQEIKSAPERAVVATLMLEAEEEVAAAAEPPVPEVIPVAASTEGRVSRLGLIPPDPRSVDLVHARRVVTAGLGAAADDLLENVRELAELLEGSLGATRPVVDEGWLPKERLIGQTGRTVAPELYLALGVSGSPHHVAGVTKAGRVLSINRDSRAPIFGFSDVGYVADLRAVLPLLVGKIKEWRDAGAQ